MSLEIIERLHKAKERNESISIVTKGGYQASYGLVADIIEPEEVGLTRFNYGNVTLDFSDICYEPIAEACIEIDEIAVVSIWKKKQS